MQKYIKNVIIAKIIDVYLSFIANCFLLADSLTDAFC